MQKHLEPIRTREQAAARLLDLSGYLSSSTFIHRPFDRTLMKPVVGDLQTIIEKLPELGYEADSSAHKLVSSVLSTIIPSSSESVLSLPTRIVTAKLLLDAALSVSTSAAPLDLRLPNETLYLILDYVKSDINPRRRRNTLQSLCSTSTLWRKIALPTSHSELVITSCLEFSRRFASRSYLVGVTLPPSLELLHIDLSDASCKCNFEPIERWTIDHRARVRVNRLELDLQVEEDERPDDHYGWQEWAVQMMEMAKSYSVTMSAFDKEDYTRAMTLLGDYADRSRDRLELYIGQSPIHLQKDIVDERLWQLEQWYLHRNDPAWGGLPIFVNYTVLSIPWLAFTVPNFLLESLALEYPEPELILPPSSLEHLELSLEFGPSDPVEALRQVDIFFETISPKLERLALRLRLTSPHPSALNEITFTDHFIGGLLSCSKLNHLELGGFGLSPDYLSRLIRLPLTTLIVLPILPLPSLGDLKSLLVDTPDLATSGLQEFCVQAIAGQNWEFYDFEENETLRLAYEAVGVELIADHKWQLKWGDYVEQDYGIMLKLAEAAGVV